MSGFSRFKIRRYANAVASVCLYELAPDRFDVNVKKVLKEAIKQWNINGTNDLIEKLNWLISKGKRDAFDDDRRKLTLISEESREAFIQSATVPHDRNFSPFAIVYEGKPQLPKGGVAAVDFAWCILLAMAGIRLKYIDQDHAQAFITQSILRLQESYYGWDEFIIGFAVGAAYASGQTYTDFFNRHNRFFMQQLIGRNSPARRLKWKAMLFA
jgi:hypothetical protein